VAAARARPPRQVERETARAFLRDQAELLRGQLRAGVRDSVDPAAAALADFCLALLNRNELIYVP